LTVGELIAELMNKRRDAEVRVLYLNEKREWMVREVRFAAASSFSQPVDLIAGQEFSPAFDEGDATDGEKEDREVIKL
jgi:hypothetical protein